MTRHILTSVLLIILIGCSKNETPTPTPTPPQKSSEKNITSFSFMKADNLLLPEDYSGSISGSNIALVVPNGINVTALKAKFSISDKAVIKVGNVIQISGVTANDFSFPITYNVEAENGTVMTYNANIQRNGILSNPNIVLTTSYAKSQDMKTYISFAPIFKNYHIYSHLARIAYDFDADGDEDIIAARTSETQNTLAVEYYRNNAAVFQEYQTMFNGNVPAMVHPRKAILNDFNNDGKMDVILAGHGYDQPPYPGEKPYLLLNQNGTSFQSSFLNIVPGFYHSVTAGDVDNDGDIDLFFTDSFGGHKILLNNGNAVFTVDNTILPNEIRTPSQLYTSEFYDINKDGYLDLVIAGHEFADGPTIILWGNNTGKYIYSSRTVLPAVAGRGIVLDIDFYDFDKDGQTDILLNRTSDNPFYAGYYLQLLKNNGSNFTNVTSTTIINNSTNTGEWISNLRFFDYDNDGDKDIITDDRNYNLIWKNMGGVFTRQ